MSSGCASGTWRCGKRAGCTAIAASMVAAGLAGCATTTRHNSSSTPALSAPVCAVPPQAKVSPATSADGAQAWVLIFSADTNAKLEGRQIHGRDGAIYQNLRALDCLVDAVVHARHLCTSDWRHDSDVATELPDGRLLIRIYCIDESRA